MYIMYVFKLNKPYWLMELASNHNGGAATRFAQLSSKFSANVRLNTGDTKHHPNALFANCQRSFSWQSRRQGLVYTSRASKQSKVGCCVCCSGSHTHWRCDSDTVCIFPLGPRSCCRTSPRIGVTVVYWN